MSGSLTNPGNIDPAGTNSFTFAVMGDVHVGPYGRVLQSAIEHSKAAGDAFVVTSGDNTYLGKEEEFQSFKDTFTNLGVAYRASLGNHDLYFDGWKFYANILGRSIYSFDADNVHFTMLDSGNGVLGEAQLNWLESDLKASSQPIKIVVTHFPPVSADFDTLFKMSSDEEAAILKDLLHKNNVNYLFAGHYHGYRERKIGNTTYIVTGAINTFLDPGENKHYIRVNVNSSNVSVQKIDL